MNSKTLGAVAATVLSAIVAGISVAADTPQPAIMSGKAASSLLLDVARAGDRLVAVGERGHIVLSDDAGKTWRQVASPVRSMLTTVYFVSPQQGWIVGHDSVVLATADAGESWQVQHYREFSGEEPAPIEDQGIDEGAMLDEAEYEDDESAGRDIGSRDGVPLLDVWFADAQVGVAIGAYGLMLRTTDGGKSWTDVSSRISNRDGWHFNAIGGIPGNRDLVLIAGEKGTLYRSVDGGATFSTLRSPYDGSFFGITGSTDGALYVYGLQGRLFRSINRGDSWSRLETGVTSGLNDGCELGNGSLMVAGNAGIVLVRVPGDDKVVANRRSDRKSVMSCVAGGGAAVLVGEGGARQAAANGLTP
ncbi:MAG: YCF48-related protein [Pseudomonadota bacterium]